MRRSYSELLRLQTYDERFEYLRLGGGVGRETFGVDRYINQLFYGSAEWNDVRQRVILRDNGCDLGVPGFEIQIGALIHHINPMTLEHIRHHDDSILDPENLITTTHKTHNAIHYGTPSPYPKVVVQRVPGDTDLW